MYGMAEDDIRGHGFQEDDIRAHVMEEDDIRGHGIEGLEGYVCSHLVVARHISIEKCASLAATDRAQLSYGTICKISRGPGRKIHVAQAVRFTWLRP